MTEHEDQIAEYRLKLEETAALVARIRHEINNPLTGVLGQAQLLLREELSERSRKRVQTIEDLALRLRDIVAQLREVQKPNADGDSLVGMFMHGLICRPGAFDCLLADATIDFLAPFQRAGETFAGFPNLFSGDVGRGRHEGARVFRERFHVVAD